MTEPVAATATCSTGRVVPEVAASIVEAAAFVTEFAALTTGAALVVAAAGRLACVIVSATGELFCAGALVFDWAGALVSAAFFTTGSTAFEAVPVTASVTGVTDSVVALTTDPTVPSV